MVLNSNKYGVTFFPAAGDFVRADSREIVQRSFLLLGGKEGHSRHQLYCRTHVLFPGCLEEIPHEALLLVESAGAGDEARENARA